jgi:hypothetical protein
MTFGRDDPTPKGSVVGHDRGWRQLEVGHGEASKGLTQIKQGFSGVHRYDDVGASREATIQHRAKRRETWLFRVIR